MTLLSSVNKVRAEGDGVTVAFSADFEVASSSELQVYKVTRATDALGSLLTLGVDYTVAISAVTNKPTVTYTVAPTALQDSFIRRIVTYTQEADIPSNNIFREVQVEKALDKSVKMAQQLAEEIARCVKLPILSTLTDISLPTPSAGKALIWNATADGFDNLTVDLADLDATVVAAAASAAAALASENAAAASESAAISAAAKIPDIGVGDALKILRANAGATAGEYATLTSILNITGLTNKGTPIDADELILSDSADSNALKALTMLALKTYVGSQVNVKIGSFSWDVSTTGDQAITGVGFTPKAVIFFGCITSTVAAAWGFITASAQGGMYHDHAETANAFAADTAQGLAMMVSAGNYAQIDYSAFGADGFTVAKTKTGSPTGTATVNYLAIG